MKRVLFGFVAGLCLSIVAAAFAATGSNPTSSPIGGTNTSPVVVCGSFQYNGGPLASGVLTCGGTFTANSGSAVTVANTYVTANSVILFGLKTASGTPAAPFLVTVTPGTGFTVNSGGSDTSTYNYIILG